MPITKTGKSKDGLTQYRVRVNYTDSNGEYKRIERTAYGKAEAQALEHKLTLEASATNSPAQKMTLNDLADEYFESLRHDLRETSADKSASTIRFSVLSMLGNTRLDRLNAKVLQEWKNKIGDSDRSLTTKKSYYKYFNAMLNFAVKRDYLPSNPLKKIGNFRDTQNLEETEELRYYTVDEYRMYSAAAKSMAEEKNIISEWAYYVFFSLAFYTGMRKGEINALRWSDFDGLIIHVRRSINQKLLGEDRETGPKNKSSIRDLQAPQPLIDILADHKQRLIDNGTWNPSNYICGGKIALRDSNIDHRNRQIAKAANLPHITIHEFRHTHASLLANEGINIQEIARRLGHSDVQETWRTYSHLYPREEERAVSILNKIR